LALAFLGPVFIIFLVGAFARPTLLIWAVMLSAFFALISAIILGIGAMIQIAYSKGTLKGRGLAIAGIIIASGSILYGTMIMMFSPRQGCIRSRVSRVKVDMRTMATAIESYYVDNCLYPAMIKGEGGANSFAGKNAGVYKILTFRVWKNQAEKETFKTLTTPINYLESYSPDPFAISRGATYGYYHDANGWILWSWGPDVDENKPDQWDLAADVEKVYYSAIRQPSLELLCGTSSAPAHHAYTYDPTNGTVSPGDIWRVKQ
jgi:hypothetical protein